MKVPGLSNNPVQPAAFTAEEAADYLRISRAGVYRLMKNGELPRAKIGDRTVVRRVDLDAFLEASVLTDPVVRPHENSKSPARGVYQNKPTH